MRFQHGVHPRRLRHGTQCRVRQDRLRTEGFLHRLLRLGHLPAQHRQPFDHVVPAHAGPQRPADPRAALRPHGLCHRRLHLPAPVRRRSHGHADRTPRERTRRLERLRPAPDHRLRDLHAQRQTVPQLGL